LFIYDLQGQLILNQDIKEPTQPINISQINGGQLYLFRVRVSSESGDAADKSFMIYKS